MKNIIIIMMLAFLIPQAAFANWDYRVDRYMHRDDPGLRNRAHYGRTYVKSFDATVKSINTFVEWDRHIIVVDDEGKEIKVRLDRMTDYTPSWTAVKVGSRINIKMDAEGYASFIEIKR